MVLLPIRLRRRIFLTNVYSICRGGSTTTTRGGGGFIDPQIHDGTTTGSLPMMQLLLLLFHDSWWIVILRRQLYGVMCPPTISSFFLFFKAFNVIRVKKKEGNLIKYTHTHNREKSRNLRRAVFYKKRISRSSSWRQEVPFFFSAPYTHTNTHTQ